MTTAERAGRGKEARAAVPRSSHGTWQPAADRTDPITLLERQASTRVPELVPIRHGRMAASPFAYFRGAALPMAADLAASPRIPLDVQLCGDAHLSNFGGFASPERSLVFDLNDFDETNPGPFDWDVKRLAASFEIAGRSMGLDESTRSSIVLSSARSYREAMRAFAAQSNLDVWYAKIDVDEVLNRYGTQADKTMQKRFWRGVTKAESKDRLKAAAKLTHDVDGEPRFISDPPLLVPVEELAGEMDPASVHSFVHDAIRKYRTTLPRDRRWLLDSYRYVDLARKVVGVGSVGTRAWVVLFVGRDNGDPLLLQVKEAEASVLEPYVGTAKLTNHGARVVDGQRLMQAASDILLGFARLGGPDGVERDFYMRQLWDWKASANIDSMRPEGLEIYAQLCGWTLARAHARSGDRIAIAAYLGANDTFDRAIGKFAAVYAAQNERDYKAFLAAIEQGRLQAKTGI